MTPIEVAKNSTKMNAVINTSDASNTLRYPNLCVSHPLRNAPTIAPTIGAIPVES